MSNHVIFCSDIASRDASENRITRLQGWCIASAPIRGLALQTATSAYEPIAYGLKRDDVGRAYPGHGRAAISGFRMLTAMEIPPGHPVGLCLEIDAGEGLECHVVSVNLDTRDVQTIELNEETRARGAKIDNSIRALTKIPALEARLKDSLQTQRGLTLRLDLINKCNLRCIMCHFSDEAVFRRPTKQLTTPEFKALFHELGPNVKEVILSCGDEPLMSKYLTEILYYLAEEHPAVAIEFCTNAMLMKAPIRKAIMETRVARIVFSIDAVSKELLESIRVGCRYEQVIGNIMALRDLKEQMQAPYPAFLFNFVMMDRNIHEAAAFLHVAKALGAKSVDLRLMVPIEPYFNPVDRLDTKPAKYNYYREKIAREARKLGLKYFLSPPLATDERWAPSKKIDVDLSDFHRVVADAAGSDFPRVSGLRTVPVANGQLSAADEFGATFCPRPFSEIMVRDQDEVLPCPWHAKPLGYLREGKNLMDIFFGENFARVRRNMLRPEGDPNCAECPIKSGHLPTESNN